MEERIMRERITVPAVRDKDMRDILNRFSLSTRLDSGELHCPSCNSVLRWENVGGFVIVQGEPRLFCSASDCLEEIKQESEHV
jgi:hypothetical protein